MAGQGRTVKASTVLAWWDRMVEKIAQDPTDMQIRGLENALYFVCRRNGAKLTRGKPVTQHPETPGAVEGDGPAQPGFDWTDGEMVFDVLQPEGLVAELERVTGIPEHANGGSGSST